MPRAATILGAEAIGFGKDLGSLEAGKLADLLVFDAGQIIHGAPVVQPSAIATFRDHYVVAPVGRAGAREDIRVALARAGFVEPQDCCAVA